MAYSPLKSPFYEDVPIGELKVASLGEPGWKEQRADPLMKALGADDRVQMLVSQLSDDQSRTLLAALRRAMELAEEQGQPLLLDFWERQYNEQTSPGDSDRFVYVRESLPRVSSAKGAEFRLSVQFS